jgi:choline dehydrogenase-like flavoprotein
MVFDEQCDLVVVGSGPAGAAYARTVADLAPDARIVMVDAGPVLADPPGLHVANIRDDATREAAQIASQGPHDHAAYAPMSEDEIRTRRDGGHDTSMLRRPGLFRVGSGPIDGDSFPASHAAHNVGGMGSHWFGACPRPSESERISFIARDVMDEALVASEALLRVSSTQFGASHLADPLRAILSGLFDSGRAPDRRVQPMPMAVNVVDNAIYRTGSNIILGDLLDAGPERFALLANTVCRRVLIDNDRATGIEVQPREGGPICRIGARAVVVAADSFHGPQLLFASGIRPPALGRYLNEHPQLTVMAEFEGVSPGGPVDLSFGGGVLGDRTIVSRMTSGVMWVPHDGDGFPFHVQISQVEPASLLAEDQEAARRNAVLSVSFFLPTDIQAENRVSFSGTETDWLGRPKMSIRFTLSENDRSRLARARDNLERICSSIGRILPGHSPRIAPAGTSLHYEGTMRMGQQNDGTSVCDTESRVWNVPGLWIGGNGVISTPTACNPTLVTVALAILGGHSIATSLKEV